MNKSKVILEVLRRIMKKAIVENAPVKAPEKPKQEPGTKERPTTPKEPKKPSRSLDPEDPETIPDIKPKAQTKKASMNEADMIAKIVKKYRAAKKNG